MSRDGPGSERLVLDEDDDAPILPAAREDSVLERARRLLGRQAGGSGSFDDGAEDDGPSLGSGPSGGAKDSDAQPLVAQPDGPADGAASVPSTPAMAAVQDDAKSVSDTPRAWGAGGAWAAPGSQASGRGKAGQDDAASVGSGAGDGGSDLTASLSTMNKGLSALYLGGSGAASAKGSEAPGGRHSQDIVGDRLAAATRTPVRQPSRAPQWDSSPPGSLPTTVEACHATIRAQRSQVVELGARVAQLEQGNNRLRETGISLRVQAGQDASALEIARQRLEEVEAEAQKLRKERDLLLQRVQEQTRRARDAATRATEMQISLGSLGRDAAFGFASVSTKQAAAALGLSSSARAARAAVAARAPLSAAAASATRALPSGATYRPPPSSAARRREAAAAAEAASSAYPARRGYGDYPQQHHHQQQQPPPPPRSMFSSQPSPYAPPAPTPTPARYGAAPAPPSPFTPAASPAAHQPYGSTPRRPAGSSAVPPPPAGSPAHGRSFGHAAAPSGFPADKPHRATSAASRFGEAAGAPSMEAGSVGTDGPSASASSRAGVQVPREGFFTAIREGIVLVKHCGWPARPHKRLVWLDVSDGDNPTLRWGPEGGGRSGKQSRSLGLRDIQQFAPGISSQILRRYGRSDQAGRYMSFSTEDGPTLDLEFETEDDQVAFFNHAHAMLSAYAEAFSAGLTGDAVTASVALTMDGTARRGSIRR